MLRYNFNNASGLCARQWGTTYGLSRYFYSRSELRNYTASEGFENNKAGIPNGHTDPSSWILPQSDGSISAYEELRSEVSLSLAPGELRQIVGNTALSFSSSATIRGIAVLEGSITPFTALSPEALADAVWRASLAEYSGIAGSTGEALDAAAAGGGGGGGGGVTDWTSTERQQIRHRLGIDGSASTPSASPSLATPTSVRNALSTELARIDVPVSSVAGANTQQIRSELSVELARIDVSVSSVAGANTQQIRNELSVELGRIDVPVSSVSGANTQQIRNELSVELGRIDVAISTRSNANTVQIRQEIDTNSTKLQEISDKQDDALTTNEFIALS